MKNCSWDETDIIECFTNIANLTLSLTSSNMYLLTAWVLTLEQDSIQSHFVLFYFTGSPSVNSCPNVTNCLSTVVPFSAPFYTSRLRFSPTFGIWTATASRPLSPSKSPSLPEAFVCSISPPKIISPDRSYWVSGGNDVGGAGIKIVGV